MTAIRTAYCRLGVQVTEVAAFIASNPVAHNSVQIARFVGRSKAPA